MTAGPGFGGPSAPVDVDVDVDGRGAAVGGGVVGGVGGIGELAVEVVRSPRRRKTVEAAIVGDRLRVRIPARFTAEEERVWVERMTERLRRRRSADRFGDLSARAARLAASLDLPRPREIRWVENQTSRWGSCTVATGTVRISTALAPFPDWVVDYVIVHELAHLRHADHSAAFWALVGHYPLAERARGFLIAKGLDPG